MMMAAAHHHEATVPCFALELEEDIALLEAEASRDEEDEMCWHELPPHPVAAAPPAAANNKAAVAAPLVAAAPAAAEDDDSDTAARHDDQDSEQPSDAGSDDACEEAADAVRITANARAVSSCGRPLLTGGWRGCCKSPWCDREDRHRGLCNHRATIPGPASCAAQEQEQQQQNDAKHKPDDGACETPTHSSTTADDALLRRLLSSPEPPEVASTQQRPQQQQQQQRAATGQASGHLGLFEPEALWVLPAAYQPRVKDLVLMGEPADGDAAEDAPRCNKDPADASARSNDQADSPASTHSSSSSAAACDNNKASAGASAAGTPSNSAPSTPSCTSAAGTALFHAFGAQLVAEGSGVVSSAHAAAADSSAAPAPAAAAAAAPQRPPRVRSKPSNSMAKAAAAAAAAGMTDAPGVSPKSRKRPCSRFASNPSGGHCCTQCGAVSTPVWRAGPAGPKTLCNACGVRHMKVAKRK